MENILILCNTSLMCDFVNKLTQNRTNVNIFIVFNEAYLEKLNDINDEKVTYITIGSVYSIINHIDMVVSDCELILLDGFILGYNGYYNISV